MDAQRRKGSRAKLRCHIECQAPETTSYGSAQSWHHKVPMGPGANACWREGTPLSRAGGSARERPQLCSDSLLIHTTEASVKCPSTRFQSAGNGNILYLDTFQDASQVLLKS